MIINNPYGTEGLWLKGNLHTHTAASPCGHYPLKDVASVYSDRIMRYDFLAITDHVTLTDVSPVQGMNDMVVFSGVEFKKKDFQTLGINIRSFNDEGDKLDQGQIFADVTSQGGINIICHPHMYREDYWPLERLVELKNFLAIEIYNHNVKMNNAGLAVATDLWDKLLERDIRAWGIASDDFHHYSRCGGGFLHVLAREKSPGAILDAIRAGSFYASSGILLKDIGVSPENVISLSAASARVSGTVFRFIGRGGKILKEEQPTGAEEPVSYTVRGDEGYVRAEARRKDGAQAWTQPFWIE